MVFADPGTVYTHFGSFLLLWSMETFTSKTSKIVLAVSMQHRLATDTDAGRQLTPRSVASRC